MMFLLSIVTFINVFWNFYYLHLQYLLLLYERWICSAFYEKFSGRGNFNGNPNYMSLLWLHLIRFEHSFPSELRLFHYEILCNIWIFPFLSHQTGASNITAKNVRTWKRIFWKFLFLSFTMHTGQTLIISQLWVLGYSFWHD